MPDQTSQRSDPNERAVERRVRRSEDPIIALHYQLASARARAELDALVLVDDTGVLVAGAGAWPACEELAAYAPLLVRPEAIQTSAVGSRVASLTAEVEVHAIELEGCEALLCGRGASALRGETMARAADACRRILSTAA